MIIFFFLLQFFNNFFLLLNNQVHDHGHDTHVTQVRTASGCIPIDSVLSSERIGVDLNYVWDITPGIHNPDVFKAPSNCSAFETPSHPLYATLMKTVKAIATGTLWERKRN